MKTPYGCWTKTELKLMEQEFVRKLGIVREAQKIQAELEAEWKIAQVMDEYFKRTKIEFE